MASLWRHGDFLKLWSAMTISEVGSRVTREGLPYTAVALLGASPAAMGLLTAVQGMTAFIVGPVAGVLVDRYRHRPLLIGMDLGRAAVLGLVPWAAWTGNLSFALLLGVAVAAGAMTVLFDVAYQAHLPRLVGKEHLLEGNSKLAISFATAEVLGPGITGILIQLLTAPRAILIDALSFVVSAVFIGWIRRPEKAGSAEHEEAPTLAAAAAGFQFVRGQPVLRALALRTGTVFYFWGYFAALYMFFAVRELKLQPAVIGVVVALGGVSNLAGSLLSGHVSRWFRLGTVLTGASLLPALAAVLIPLAPSDNWLLAAAALGASQLLGDIGFPIYSVHELTLRQSLTPPGILGRVNALWQMLMKGLLPLGALSGGAIAGAYGARAALVVSAVGAISANFWLFFSPVRQLQGVNILQRED
ncbi:MAG: MFS transporter [Bryobacteraceae bacterium]|nr:MFS transporter [Bryobacteraceae bacterium]